MSTQQIIQELQTLELEGLQLEDLQKIQKLVKRKIREVIISKHKEEDENLPIMYLNEEDSKSVEEAIEEANQNYKTGNYKVFTNVKELIAHLNSKS